MVSLRSMIASSFEHLQSISLNELLVPECSVLKLDVKATKKLSTRYHAIKWYSTRKSCQQEKANCKMAVNKTC